MVEESEKRPKKGILRWVILVILLLFASQQFMGKRSFYALWVVNRNSNALRDSIVTESTLIESLIVVEERLKSDPDYIERVARDELGVHRPGEGVIKFVEKK